ncbi:glycosyltransferase [Actinoallomurus sp. NPDC050550]|uniref:glycosyltransferase n=1 Tax=Actinoallomurus sp. NPDC050550 TaxID=3154937 RepID=UPI003410105E
MKILVYPHAMEIGGSQLNAIELAAAVRDLGHEVAVIAEPGPLVERVSSLGLEHLPLDAGRRRPSPATVRLLRRLIAERGYDVVHGYEWPPGIEAFYAAGRRAAAVCTVMSMSVAPFIPASLPLVVGTHELRERTARGRPGPVHLIEPPIDVDANAPGHPVDGFRARFALDEDHFDVVVVGRLVQELKLEGVLTAVDVVGELGRELPVRLVIVGDGPARPAVEARAERINTALGRRAVVLTGRLDDPRPAYAAASVALAMGGSALRALAFARPLIVQGERGFFELLTPESCGRFLKQGWYGLGDGNGPVRLATILRELVAHPERGAELGAYGRDLVVLRFGLRRAARVQEQIYREALAWHSPARELASTAGRVMSYKLRRRYRRLRGTAARDDFNAVAGSGPDSRPVSRPVGSR